MDVEQAADKVYLAAVEGTPFPVLSAEYADMTEAGSYAVQKAYSLKRLEGKRPAGFKAGLTTEATMKRFGASTPFAAPLFPEGAMDGSAESVVVDRASFGVLMLEAEIAFILGEPVDASLKDEAELKAKIESVAAAVELPDLSFTDMKLLKAMDINASAISSKAWILGKRIPLADAPNLNELVPVMTLDGVEATRGRGSDALGDQWKALLWLVNKMVEEGWTMEKGDVLRLRGYLVDEAAQVRFLEPGPGRLKGAAAGRPAAVHRGADVVARQAQAARGATVHPVLVNGLPGVVTLREGIPVSLMAFTIVRDRIVAIDGIRDADRVRQLVAGILPGA